MSLVPSCSSSSNPKSILKPERCASRTCSRSVSFCFDPSVRMADSYDRSPVDVTTELSWNDIEELRRLQADCDDDDSGHSLDDAIAEMDLPALLAAAPSSLLPLLPPLSTILRPVPTLTLPSPRNRLGMQKRSSPLIPASKKRPLLDFLPLLPVEDPQRTLAAPSNRTTASLSFTDSSTSSDVEMSDSLDSASSSSDASPLTPSSLSEPQAFEFSFKRRRAEQYGPWQSMN